MDEPTELRARIQVLETRSAHQDDIIDDLNAAVTAQWQAIEALRHCLERLGHQVEDAEARAGAAAPQPPPPHY